MVVALGPGKFYGSSLPRPRFYTDLENNNERVDPPLPVLDPLLSWANEAHWTMGGLSFKRQRLQGRIEGNVKRLRAEKERKNRNQTQKAKKDQIQPRSSVSSPQVILKARLALLDEDDDSGLEDVTPLAPIVPRKRARALSNELDNADEVGISSARSNQVVKRGRILVKKTCDDKSDNRSMPYKDRIALPMRSQRTEEEETSQVDDLKSEWKVKVSSSMDKKFTKGRRGRGAVRRNR